MKMEKINKLADILYTLKQIKELKQKINLFDTSKDKGFVGFYTKGDYHNISPELITCLDVNIQFENFLKDITGKCDTKIDMLIHEFEKIV
ncbi:MAG: hypothetical protein LBV03_05950 [Fusobacteriales bacterium]|nr:hypothetical protein [Fusobacteriales bacterium]